MCASTRRIYYGYYNLSSFEKKHFEPEQIALAPLLECEPQCGTEEEDGSAEEEEYEWRRNMLRRAGKQNQTRPKFANIFGW